MNIFERNIEDELINWELYRAYGLFNLCFEEVIAEFRKFLIEMVRLNYGFDVDWEDPNTEEPVDYRLQDRLLKIILHDDGAFSIVEKCRSCFFDMAKPDIQKVLSDNDISPLNISTESTKIAELIFKNALDLVKLRNNVVHSHYSGVIFDILPRKQLHGVKSVKTAKGMEERTIILTIDNLNRMIAHMDELSQNIRTLNYVVTTNEKDSVLGFDAEVVDVLKKMDFRLK